MAAEHETADFLVDAHWIGARRGDPNLILVDTRPAADYWAGHLEGARHFDPFPFHHSDTSEAGLREFNGQLGWIFSALGITPDATVVFYENDSGMRATRVAWMLAYAGHRDARMLDGGLKCAPGAALTTTVKPHAYANFRVAPRADAIVGHPEMVTRMGGPGMQIFDVRSDEEYFGERVRSRRAGAIPGAIHRDWTHNLLPDGRFKPAAQLRAEFAALGLKPEHEIVPYCQGGYRSANAWIALKIAGYQKVRNYLGSWGEWGNRAELPIEFPRRKPAGRS